MYAKFHQDEVVERGALDHFDRYTYVYIVRKPMNYNWMWSKFSLYCYDFFRIFYIIRDQMLKRYQIIFFQSSKKEILRLLILPRFMIFSIEYPRVGEIY